MKIKTLLLISLTCISILSNAQDLITKKNSEIVEAKVLEVNISEIKYKNFRNITGPTYTILKNEVKQISYENGTKEILETENILTPVIAKNMAAKGKFDAKMYYNGVKSGRGGVLTGSLVSPLIGLIPAICTSATYPNDINLNYPKPELMKDMEYKKSYMNTAKKIKQRKIWGAWAVGLGTNVVLSMLIRQ